MIFTTTSAVEGRDIERQLGLVSADVVRGVNSIRDLAANLADTFGTRSGTLEREIATARAEAAKEIGEAAEKLRADAVIGLRVDVQLLRDASSSMVMVTATGTAVRLGPDPLAEARKARAAMEDDLRWHVEIEGRTRGPFSVAQLREMVAANRISGTAQVKDDASMTIAVCDLVKD